MEKAMTNNPVYTIGYGARPVEEFIQLLLRYEITVLVDVRFQPYSRFRPAFSKEPFMRDALLQRLQPW